MTPEELKLYKDVHSKLTYRVCVCLQLFKENKDLQLGEHLSP